jgi:pilus assembly protein CpaC
MMRKDSQMYPSAAAPSLLRDTLRMAGFAALLGAALGLTPLGLGQARAEDVSHVTISGKSFGATRAVNLSINKSLILDLPVDAREVIVSGPAIASAILRSKRRAIVQGLSAGDTNIFFLDGAGRTITVLDMQVGLPEASRDQVMLKVTVAEVQRSIAKQLGINLSGSFSVGSITGAFNGGIPDMAAGGGNATIPIGDSSLDIELRALETHGAFKTLAEPVLTALSGQPANFLAGGEIPYNRVVDGNVVTDFKPYGVELAFTPTVNDDGTVTLVVNSSVSEPTTGGAINKREVSTSVVLGAGETLSMAGMLSESSRHDINRFPGLGDIPILGALFRSREYRTDQTELVFLVTPYFARAKQQMPELPTDSVQFAGDAEAVFLGHIESIYGVGPGGIRGSYDGSVGFLLD